MYHSIVNGLVDASLMKDLYEWTDICGIDSAMNLDENKMDVKNQKNKISSRSKGPFPLIAKIKSQARLVY